MRSNDSSLGKKKMDVTSYVPDRREEEKMATHAIFSGAHNRESR